MLPVLPVHNIQEWDSFTIKNEPITSIDLMERASAVYANWLSLKIGSINPRIMIIASKGNNGGDALAIARLLSDKAYDIEVCIADIQPKASNDFDINLQRLEQKRLDYKIIKDGDDIPDFGDYDIIVDGLFGSGLARPITGFWERLVVAVNNSGAKVFSIDIPSGMYADKPCDGKVVECYHCLSFETPKLAFVMPENSEYIKNWEVKSIGLDSRYLDKLDIDSYYICKNDVRNILKPRNKFDHKGKNGHALIIGGSKGMAGAMVLSSRAAIRSGVGLVTALVPDAICDVVQTSIPEVMTLTGFGKNHITAAPEMSRFKAIGVGIGLNTYKETVSFLRELLEKASKPMVIDADALNIVSQNKELLRLIPKNSILTPHPLEFERLFGSTNSDFERLELARRKAKALGVFIVLKGHNTAISTPEGIVYLNSSGNSGMATAGSGDVLTGILTSFLTQGYSSLEACIAGVFIHGYAADIAKKTLSEFSLIASDIIDNLGRAFIELTEVN